MIIDLAKTDKSWRDLHRLYLGFIQPRPIAWASTVGRDGSVNLAPFSFYNMVSANPPIVIFSPALNPSGFRHNKNADSFFPFGWLGIELTTFLEQPVLLIRPVNEILRFYQQLLCESLVLE